MHLCHFSLLAQYTERLGVLDKILHRLWEPFFHEREQRLSHPHVIGIQPDYFKFGEHVVVNKIGGNWYESHCFKGATLFPVELVRGVSLNSDAHCFNTDSEFPFLIVS